jgi:hypothetical protein
MKKKSVSKKPPEYVLIRASLAGVHYGEIVKRDEHTITLRNARRLWQWFGASLSQVATVGVPVGHAEDFRACARVDRLDLRAADCVEIMTLQSYARFSLDNQPEWLL